MTTNEENVDIAIKQTLCAAVEQDRPNDKGELVVNLVTTNLALKSADDFFRAAAQAVFAAAGLDPAYCHGPHRHPQRGRVL
jgi:hypothetical protein